MDKEELKKYLENYKFEPTLKYEQEQIAKIIERNKEIETLIYKLPQPYQTVIYFKYISSFSFYEIAAI